MEDFGDILFYIIAAVIALVTTLGRKKKKPVVIPVPVEDEALDNQVDSLVIDEEISELEYQVEDEYFLNEGAPSIREGAIAYKPDKLFSFDPDLEGSYEEPMAEQFNKEGESQLEREDLIKENELVDEKEEAEDIISNFDLREAVIFSEILKRNDY